MTVILKNSPVTYEAIPCGNGDTIEIRHFYKNGTSKYVSGRGKNWFRADGKLNNQIKKELK